MFADTLDGQLVEIEEDVFRVVKEIQHRFPELKLRYLNPEHGATLTEPPYIIIEQCLDGVERVVKRVWELNSKLIDELYAMQNKTAVDLEAEFQLNNLAAKAQATKVFEDARVAAKDLAVHAFKSPKGRYTFKNDEGKLVTIEDD